MTCRSWARATNFTGAPQWAQRAEFPGSMLRITDLLSLIARSLPMLTAGPRRCEPTAGRRGVGCVRRAPTSRRSRAPADPARAAAQRNSGSADQRLVADAVGLGGLSTEASAPVGFVLGVAAVEPLHARVAFE